MTYRRLALAASGGSFLLLVGAFLFQAFGYPPCAMCLWQRWPHVIAVAIGVLVVTIPSRPLAWLGALAAAVTSGIGFFHAGVEKDWWEGPSSCTGTGGLDGLTGADLLATDGPRVIMCDVVSWQFLGISMAGWNGLFSAALLFIWIMAARRA